MPCPWKGIQQLDCKNDAAPILDQKKMAGVDDTFRSCLFGCVTKDNGVCLGMTIKWCEQVFRGDSGLRHPGAMQLGLVSTGGSTFSPGDQVRTLHGDYNFEYARRLVYPANDQERHKKKRQATMATAGAVNMVADRKFWGYANDIFYDCVKAELERSEQLLVLSVKLVIQGQNTALAQASGWHAIGVSPKRGVKAIFDPNWGLFEYSDDTGLVEALKAGLMNYFTRTGSAALKAVRVKVTAVSKGIGFTIWEKSDVDEMDAMLAALKASATN